MNRFLTVSVLSLSTLFTVFPAWADRAGASRPNVLFVAIDDLNDWVGCLNGHPQVKTPNIDRLASRGVLFTNAHCQTPICMPSRASLLTGTYPWQNGAYMIEQEFSAAPGLKGLVTLPRYFTLVELCALPIKEDLQGHSLVPLLKDPARSWEHPALTTHHPGNHAVRTDRWRYIRYVNGDEELYDHDGDPDEWKNLANDPKYADVKRRLAAQIPKTNAPYAPRLPRQKFTQEFDWSTP